MKGRLVEETQTCVKTLWIATASKLQNMLFQLKPTTVFETAQAACRLGDPLSVSALALPTQVVGCSGHEKCYPPYKARYLLEYPYSEQTMVYSHAFLAHWGHNVMLAAVDVDEYMAIQEPQRIIQDLIVRGCIDRRRHATFLRFNMVCDRCRGECKY